jgi:hypothetical protein
LLSRYNELQLQHADCQRELQQALQKAAHCKGLAKAWYMYAMRHGSHDLSTSAIVEGDSNICRNDDPSGRAAGLRESPDERDYRAPSRTLSEQRDTAITSSQTTIVETDEGIQAPTAVEVKLELDLEDEPVFVSERNLKRKRNQEDHSSEHLRRIKPEPVASQSFSQGIPEVGNDMPMPRLQLTKTMTSDLEIDGPTMQTPRKLRYKHRQAPLADSGVTELSHLRQVGTGAAILGEKARRRSSNRRASIVVKDERLDKGQSRVLRQISGNVPAKKRNPTRTPRVRRQNAENHLAMLSEDGDLGPNNLKPAKPQETRDKHNLDEMLQQPLSSKPMTPGKTMVKSAKRLAGARSTPHLTPSKASTVPTAGSRSKIEDISNVNRKQRDIDDKTSATDDVHNARNLPPVRPDEEPLRIRNPDTLQLSDFKINPEYMGSKFAFTDTLRGRDQRQGLHTCTRPDCCGDTFRRVIEMGGNAASGKSDAQALEMYLGPDWSDVMSPFDPEKRKEMTMNAHIYALSHESGKHKHAFERRSTPPGFWRTDMPTTQEAADDRSKKADLERQAVKERWLDATRGQGRWKFRDE